MSILAFHCFSPHYLLSTFLLEMAKNKFFKEIHDGVLYEAAESFDAEISVTNKEEEEEEAKTVQKSRLENRLRLVFSTFHSCSQMPIVFSQYKGQE